MPEQIPMRGAELETWVFFCPLHGMEATVFCFRAFDESLIENWALMHVMMNEKKTTLDQKQYIQTVTKG